MLHLKREHFRTQIRHRQIEDQFKKKRLNPLSNDLPQLLRQLRQCTTMEDEIIILRQIKIRGNEDACLVFTDGEVIQRFDKLLTTNIQKDLYQEKYALLVEVLFQLNHMTSDLDAEVLEIVNLNRSIFLQELVILLYNQREYEQIVDLSLSIIYNYYLIGGAIINNTKFISAIVSILISERANAALMETSMGLLIKYKEHNQQTFKMTIQIVKSDKSNEQLVLFAITFLVQHLNENDLDFYCLLLSQAKITQFVIDKISQIQDFIINAKYFKYFLQISTKDEQTVRTLISINQCKQIIHIHNRMERPQIFTFFTNILICYPEFHEQLTDISQMAYDNLHQVKESFYFLIEIFNVNRNEYLFNELINYFVDCFDIEHILAFLQFCIQMGVRIRSQKLLAKLQELEMNRNLQICNLASRLLDF